MQKTWQVLVLQLAVVAAASGQAGGAGAQMQPTRAQQVPLSGRQAEQSGSVSVRQSTSQAGSSVDVTQIDAQIQGAYRGSVPATDLPGGSTITLEQAIQLGLKYNLGAAASSASVRQTRAQRLAALSALMPTINAGVSETGAKTDLQTLGLAAGAFGSLPLPTVVGPFHYYDARATLNVNLFDLTAVHNLRGARETERAAELNGQDARDLIVLAVSGEYLKVLADAALVDAQASQVKYAQASYDQAVAQNQAGTRSLVDTERSLVELQTEQQRLISQRADLVKEKRNLARAIGLRLDIDVAPAEKLEFTPQEPLKVDDALRKALLQRNDLKSAAAQLRAAEESLKAAHSERMPTLNVNGYVALEGVNPNAGQGVFSGTASLNVPVWQGGRIRAEEEQARAAVEQRRAEYQDEQGQVELDVRNAFTDLETAADQVRVAQSNRDLALKTLQQSQDRYAAGVATSVEVVQSQETLAAADRDYVDSVYSHNVAKIGLARALGQTQNGIAQFLKGK